MPRRRRISFAIDVILGAFCWYWLGRLRPRRPLGWVCPRDSDWCDGRICRDLGINCPKADVG